MDHGGVLAIVWEGELELVHKEGVFVLRGT